jgi:hypothetical protein
MEALVKLLKQNGIDYCHVGVEYDLINGIVRLIATSAPLRGLYYKTFYSSNYCFAVS